MVGARAAREVFAYWQQRTGHARAQWTEERGRVLVSRLREEPGSIEEKVAGLKLAVDGALLDPWFNGAETGKRYLDFENVFLHKGRNRIEKLQNAARRGPARPPGDRKVEESKRVLSEMMRKADAEKRGLLDGGS